MKKKRNEKKKRKQRGERVFIHEILVDLELM